MVFPSTSVIAIVVTFFVSGISIVNNPSVGFGYILIIKEFGRMLFVPSR